MGDTYAGAHTRGDAGRHAAYMCPPAAVEAGGRQYRDATGTRSSLTHARAHTHNDEG